MPTERRKREELRFKLSNYAGRQSSKVRLPRSNAAELRRCSSRISEAASFSPSEHNWPASRSPSAYPRFSRTARTLSRRAYVVFAQLNRELSPRRNVRRQDSAGHESRRYSGRRTYEIRARGQHESCESDEPCHS